MFKKKRKTPYYKSFAKRLTWRIMIRMIIIMGIPSFFLFWMAFGGVYVASALVCERVLNGQCEQVRRISSDVYVATVNTALVIEENLDNPDKLYDIMERMLTTNQRLRSCGISFVENYYPKKGRWFCPYAVRCDSIIERQSIGDADHDYLNQPWFTEALSRNEGYWSKAFFDGNDKDTPLIAYMVPIHDKQGQTVAILGVDTSLDWLADRIQLAKATQHRKDSLSTWSARLTPYYFMVDSTGTLLIHPDKQRIIHKSIQEYVTEDEDSVCQKMLARQDSDEEELELESEDVILYYTPVKYTDWTLAMVIPFFYVKIFGITLGVLILLIILFGILAVWLFGRRAIKKAVKPIKLLASSADEVAKGNFTTQLPELNSHDEIHQLRDSFGKMQQSLSTYIEELKTTTAQKTAIENELRIAHDIQMSMLPKTFPPYPERHDIDIYGMLAPAKGVGGDLFDFHIRDEKLFFCIGDVAGKGIPAALVMAVTRSLFRNISSYATRPNDIVYALNNALTDGNDTLMFVTLFVGVLDLQTGKLHYCNGGHAAPLLVGRDVGVLPCDPNLPVGIEFNFLYSLQEADIDPDTTVFLYTDGLNEAENETHAQLGEERIMAVANSLLATGNHQPVTLVDEMKNAVHDFVNGAEQSDDLTMLAIQYKGRSPK